MFFVNYLPEFLYQPLKLSNVRPTDSANSKNALLQRLNSLPLWSINNLIYVHHGCQIQAPPSLVPRPSLEVINLSTYFLLLA